ncbi:hypothetical protein Tco_1241819 [Tanacetum coccineum]
MQMQPSYSATKQCTTEIREYFKKKWGKQDDKDKNIKKEENDDDIDIELDENDVYINKSRTAKFYDVSDWNEVKNLIRNERLSICAVLETHMKNDKIRNICMNVFGSWLWQNNVSLSRKGCRIAVGWDASNVKCTLITATGQSMYVQLYSRYELNFHEWINEIEIKDISSSGLHFTWTKSLLNPSSSILKKIDRVMGNNAFLSKYSTANALFLPYGISDHSLAILKVPQAMKKKIKSFRIANYVIEKLEFKDMVKEKWNLEIQRHHMYKLAKFYDSQRKIDMNPTDKALRIEGVELLKDYKEATLDEEKLLRQKTKITWLRERDKISAYFHKVLKGRINRNRIMSVCAEDGRTFENCDVANQFVKHFEGLLGISLAVTKLNEDDDHLFVSKISEEEANNMIREINEDEIKKALFDIDDDKAPGPDGFTSKFFKKKLGQLLKKSFVMLLKSSLGLILTNRIKSALNQIVDEIQSAFVPGRAMTDNILLIQDLLKGYNYINGPKRDFKKALDKFSAISGLYPNIGKCTMFCGSIDDETKENISNIFPFKEGKLPVRYLGVPLVTKKIRVADCKQLVDKVRQKLSD